MREGRRRRGRFLRRIVLAVVLTVVTATSLGSAAAASPGVRPAGARVNWPMAGGDYHDTRSNPLEKTLSPSTVAGLGVKWTFATHGDVSASAAVVDGAVYFPDWGGYLNKVDADTGHLVWQTRISSYTGIAGDTVRTSPAVSDGVVYVGDRDGAHLIAVSAATGRALWVSQLDAHPAATLTASPIVYQGVVYEGVSSQEEAFAQDPAYPCCTFRGSMTATSAATGQRIWKTYVVPDNGGAVGSYSGGAVWGGTATIDELHGTLYTATGNNYSVPQSVTDCESAGGTADRCLAADDRIDAVVAMDLRTGAVKWTTGSSQFDTWNFGCIAGPAPNNCPVNPGGDYDFGDGTHLYTTSLPDGSVHEVVGVGAKSGTFWAIDAVTGKVLWSSAAGPGSDLGGIMWGSAVDGSRVYVAEADYAHLPVTLPDGSTTTASTWAALDRSTGRVLWQIPDPSNGAAWSPLTAANGVLYASSTSGYMYAVDAATGRILWSYQAPYSVNQGPTVVDGTVYWGDGYSNIGTGSQTTGTFYAFALGCT